MQRLSRAATGLALVFTFACGRGAKRPGTTAASLAIEPASVDLAVGGTQALAVTRVLDDGTRAAVTEGLAWISAAQGVAAVSAAGLVTANAPGTTVISVAAGGLTAAATVRVTSAAPSAIALPAGPVPLLVGQAAQLVVTATYADARTASLTAGVSWRSSAPAVATVTATGLVAAVGPGSATVTASAGSLQATVAIQCTAAGLVSVAVAPDQSHLALGGTVQLQLTGSFDAGPARDLTASATWAAADPGVVSVSAAGLVTGLANGSTSVTGSATAGGLTRTATAAVTVGASTAGQVFYAGVYAADVTFQDFNGAANSPSIDAATSNPAGHAALRIVLPAGGAFVSAAPRDLSGFDALTFWARASSPLALERLGLGDSAGLAPKTAEVEIDGLAVDTTWKKFVLPLPLPSRLAHERGLAFFSDGASRATLWLADVQYEKLGSAALGAPQLRFTTASRTLQSGLTSPLTAADLLLRFPLGGAPVDLVAANPGYFTFTSDAPAVATVSAGSISGVGPGTAHLTAHLGAVDSSNTLAVTVSPAAYDPGAGYRLVWSDEFDGTAVDPKNWTFDLGSGGWGNNESEYYRAENAVVANGMLTITARQETYGDAPYTSARLQTSNKQVFTYGKFAIRAKLPYSQAMWPAFWMLGANSSSFNLYGGTVAWPGCGEIDIMEMIGGLADGSGDYTTHGTLHYLNSAGRNPAPSYAYRYPTRLSDDFHVYEVVWTPHSFTWKLDGVAYGTKIVDPDMVAFGRPMFILLNLAVGGAWGGWVDGSTVFPQTYVIDYVRAYTNDSITAAGPAGLSSAWHLMNGAASGVSPAAEDLEPTRGSVSGFQPLKTLASPATWYSAPLTGQYEDGAWSVGIFSTSPGASAVVKAEVFITAADGSSPASLGAAQVDVNKTGAGNHVSRFTLTGVPAIHLANQRLKLVLTPVSGASVTMVYNGNDFDSVLTTPWSPQ